MDISIISKDQYASWDEFVLNCNDGSFYHLSLWGLSIETAYGWKPFIIVARSMDGKIVAGVQLIEIRFPFKKYACSVPYATNSGIITQDEEQKKKLEIYIQKLCEERKWKYVELRNYSIQKTTKSKMVSQILDLQIGKDALWDKISSSVKASVRKAERNEITAGEKQKYLKEFYSIFINRMHKFGTPQHSLQLMESLLGPTKDNTTLIVVEHRENVIGGMIIGYTNSTMYEPWGVCDTRFNKYCPNDFLYWKSINWGCRNSLHYFDMGRSVRGSGVYRFKKKWGAVEKPLYYRRILQNGKKKVLTEHASESKLGIIFSDIWRRLPIGLVGWVGPYLRRYIP